MDFLKINENLTRASKFLYESNDYKLTIITGRNRDSNGVLQNITIKAENDLDALLQVFKGYDLQNAGMFNGEYTDEDLTEEDKQLKERILNCVKENKIEEGVKLLTDLYFDNFDISDYYADIVKLEAPDGHIVIDGDIDVEEWFGEDEVEKEPSINIKQLRDACVKQAKAAIKELKKVSGNEFKLVLDDKDEDYVSYQMKTPEGTPVGTFYIEWFSGDDKYFRIIAENYLNPDLGQFENQTMDGYKEWLLNNFKDITNIKTPQERLKDYEKQIKTALKPLGLYIVGKYKSGNDGMNFAYSLCDVPKDIFEHHIGRITLALNTPADKCMTVEMVTSSTNRVFLWDKSIEKCLEAITKNYKKAITFKKQNIKR